MTWLRTLNGVLRNISVVFLVLISMIGCGGSSAESPGADSVNNVRVATRLPGSSTASQVDFINAHFAYVMTASLQQEVRDAIQGPDLILYRSIQGTWTGFNQFDWRHIESHENMFCLAGGDRILTVWSSWLMDPADRVAADDPQALNHWINYYAVTASEQVYQYGFDGLFIDSASHRLSPHAVNDVMPDDYDEEAWRLARVDSLAFIKSNLPDKSVVFNGLHSEAGAEESLGNTDGGMWETFAFYTSNGNYFGKDKWQDVIALFDTYRTYKSMVMVSKKTGLTEDIQARLFIVGSYLLVSSESVIISMIDLNYDEIETIYYYPEFDLSLGAPSGGYTATGDGLFLRHFENGLVVVNPDESETVAYTLPDGGYSRVMPVGGGVVPQGADWHGDLTYQSVGSEIELGPISAVVLVK